MQTTLGRSRYIYNAESKEPHSILIKNAPYLISANDIDEVEVIQGASVYIKGGEIIAVYKTKPEISESEVDLVYDASSRGGIVITPGFINAHAHPTMYLMRSAMLLDYGQHL
ncbi:MAG: hypothetical protein HY564_02410, partial [Candidatus Jacksonbacteria bacterium]|nr:hypothetical protein [Candidatus Jacksonbacteria bacterium]